MELVETFDLFALYLNQRRLAELVGAGAIARALSTARGMSDRTTANLEVAAAKDLLLAWLGANPVSPVEDLLLRGVAKAGTMFSSVGTFRFRGVRSSRHTREVSGYRDIVLPDRAVRLKLRLNHSHVVPGSPGDLLTGQVSGLHVVAVLEGVKSQELTAIPISIGRMIRPSSRDSLELPYSAEVHADQIDSFRLCAKESLPPKRDLARLHAISESDIKAAFAQIIREDLLPKTGEANGPTCSRPVLSSEASG